MVNSAASVSVPRALIIFRGCAGNRNHRAMAGSALVGDALSRTSMRLKGCGRPAGASWHPGLAELAAWYEQVLISGDFSVAIIKDLQIFTIVSPASAVPAGYYLAVRNPVPGVLVELSHPNRSQQPSGQARRVDVYVFALAATVADAASRDNKACEHEFRSPPESRCPLRPRIGPEFREFANS